MEPPSKPRIQLWLELETRCNLKCRFCYNYWKDGSAPEPATRSTDETLAALSEILAKTDCDYVAFSGGEPLLRPDLIQLIEFVHSRRVPCILTTNGVLLTRPRIVALRNAGIRTFQIPLHSHIAAVHDKLSGGVCWEKSLSAMANVQSYGSHVVPVFVATRLNLSHLPRVVRIAGELGLRKLIFNRFIPTGLGAIHKHEIGTPSDSELAPVLDEADAVATRYGIEIHLGVPVEVPPETSRSWRSVQLASCPVRSGQRRWTMGSDLTLRRCNHSPVSSSNIDRIVRERLEAEDELAASGIIRGCQFLTPERYVQISVVRANYLH
jgi:MoaA/NifB/PqqE/SkfB family radical SAM enzyme